LYIVLIGKSESDRLGGLNVDGRIILEWILKTDWEGMSSIHVAQDKNIWWAVPDTAMNPQIL
jgi:hypothetical protein